MPVSQRKVPFSDFVPSPNARNTKHATPPSSPPPFFGGTAHVDILVSLVWRDVLHDPSRMYFAFVPRKLTHTLPGLIDFSGVLGD